MAATKKEAGGEKEKKLTPEESARLILDYLRQTNRPYSATDISNNLRNRVTKAAATKLLKDMHERKEIDGKVVGKAAVYHALQEEVEEDFFDSLSKMHAQAAELRERTAALKSEEKELRQALRDGAVTVTIPELKTSIDSLDQEKSAIETRLAKLRSGAVKPVSKEETAKIHKNYKRMYKAANARKRIRKELWADLCEGRDIAKSKEKQAELKEELGLEHMDC